MKAGQTPLVCVRVAFKVRGIWKMDLIFWVASHPRSTARHIRTAWRKMKTKSNNNLKLTLMFKDHTRMLPKPKKK